MGEIYNQDPPLSMIYLFKEFPFTYFHLVPVILWRTVDSIISLFLLSPLTYLCYLLAYLCLPISAYFMSLWIFASLFYLGRACWDKSEELFEILVVFMRYLGNQPPSLNQDLSTTTSNFIIGCFSKRFPSLPLPSIKISAVPESRLERRRSTQVHADDHPQHTLSVAPSMGLELCPACEMLPQRARGTAKCK
jgi:hypothetical protein